MRAQPETHLLDIIIFNQNGFETFLNILIWIV